MCIGNTYKFFRCSRENVQPYEYGLKHVPKSLTFRYMTISSKIERGSYRCTENIYYEFFRCSLENANHMSMVWNMFNRALDHIKNYPTKFERMTYSHAFTWS